MRSWDTDDYIYLGSKIANNGRNETEIVRRIGMAKKTFTDTKKFLTNLSIGMQTRIRMLKCFVWSVLLYGCETWTLVERMKKRIAATEMWFLRRMLRIPWTARVTNERVLEMAGVPHEMLAVIRVRQLGFVGHILRHEGLKKDVLLGRIEGRRGRGRPRMKYTDSLLKDVNGVDSVVELVRMARDREG